MSWLGVGGMRNGGLIQKDLGSVMRIWDICILYSLVPSIAFLDFEANLDVLRYCFISME